jgi:enoyl-CoA hydratase/carnithine racemase
VTDPHLLVQRDAGVVTLEFYRREKKNAITLGMYAALADTLADAASDDAVAVALLQGQADLFTSGNDVRDFLTPPDASDRPAHRFLRTIGTFPKPIVAAVGGPAIGIGTTMLMHCDFVLAATESRFQLPFVPLGLCPEAGSSLLLPQLAGHRLAAQLLLLGNPFDAEVAREAGIVTTIVGSESLLAEARTLADRLARLPRDAMRTTKALLRRPLGRTPLEAIEEEYPEFVRLLATDEARAIMGAFLARK